MQNKSDQTFRLPSRISYLKFGKMILSRWHWLLIATAAGFLFGSAFLYLRQPLFIASASFKIEEKRSELSELINVRNFYEKNNRSESEQFILRSRNVLLKARASIGHEVAFFEYKKLTWVDIYPIAPLAIEIISQDRTRSQHFEFQAINKDLYQLSYLSDKKNRVDTCHYGQIITTETVRFKIRSLRPMGNGMASYLFSFNSDEKSLEKISRGLHIDDLQSGNIIRLSLASQSPRFARDILNAILDQYINFDKSQRSSTVSQTEKFIDTLVNTISTSLISSGKELEDFKSTNPLLNSSISLSQASGHLSELESGRQSLSIQNTIIKTFDTQFFAGTNQQSLSHGLNEVTDPQLNNLINRYNELIIKRNKAFGTYTQNSEPILSLDEEIKSFKYAIHHAVSAQLATNHMASLLLSRQIDSIRDLCIQFPPAERKFIDLQSRFEINKKIHDYLCEKKLEAQISKAAITPAVTLIDRAVLPTEPVFPVAANIYTLSLLIGFTSGVLLIILTRVLNPFIYSKEAIELYTEIPVIGVVRKYESKHISNIVPVLNEPRSGFTESLRSIRYNLNFLAAEKENKIICITSEISGEGKSFLALNIAILLTLVGKKVLLVAADLRRSQLHEALSIDNNIGLSNYLCGQQQLIRIISQTHLTNLDFISSGPIPPNPAELLHSPAMGQLLDYARTKYDFVIADSAPVGLVTDGKALLSMADINLFVLRCGVSKQHFSNSPGLLQREFNLSNFAIILNDFKPNSFYSDLCHQYQSSHSYHYPSQIHTGYHKEYFENEK